MAEYRLRPKARADIEEIWNYTVNNWGERQARNYVSGLRDACIEIAENPLLGKAREDVLSGVRVYPSGKHLVFYFETEYGAEIARILHQRMDIERHPPD